MSLRKVLLERKRKVVPQTDRYFSDRLRGAEDEKGRRTNSGKSGMRHLVAEK